MYLRQVPIRSDRQSDGITFTEGREFNHRFNQGKQAFFFSCSFCCKIFWNSLIKLWIEWVASLVPILICITASSCPFARRSERFSVQFQSQNHPSDFFFISKDFSHWCLATCVAPFGCFHQWYLLHTPAELYLWCASCEWIAIKTIQE